MMRIHIPGLLVVFVMISACSASFVAAATGERFASFRNWGAYVGKSANGRVCFALSKPTASRPKNVKRGPIYFHISHWPQDGVRDEISIKFGYPLNPDVAPKITIGKKKFTLFAKNESAYVENKETERQLIEAMKGGARMVVQGRSTRGTLTTDRYSLAGVTAAIKRVKRDCP